MSGEHGFGHTMASYPGKDASWSEARESGRHALTSWAAAQHASRVRAWRATVGVSALLALSIAGNVAQGMSADIRPVILHQSTEGELVLIGEVGEMQWSLNDATRRWHATEFVSRLRRVPGDEDVFLADQRFALEHASGAARLALETLGADGAPSIPGGLAATDDPALRLARGERVLISGVRATTVQGSHGTWRVEWTERSEKATGERLGAPRSYVATLEVVVDPPKTFAAAQRNHAGWFVDHLSITPQGPAPAGTGAGRGAGP